MMRACVAIMTAMFVLLSAVAGFAGLVGSKHDLTREGERAFTEESGAACRFCHIPHGRGGAAPPVPLWLKGQKDAQIEQYPLYSWKAAPGLPRLDGPGANSLVCLSCHDGTIGGNMTYQNIAGLAGKDTSGAGRAFDPLLGYRKKSYLAGDHPTGIEYDPPGAGLAGVKSARKRGARLFGPDEDRLECSSCHNPHTTDNPHILHKPLNELCATCHAGRADGRHVMAGFGFGDDHPVAGIPDPRRPDKKLTCASCHQPHASDLPHPPEPESRNFCERCHEKPEAYAAGR